MRVVVPLSLWLCACGGSATEPPPPFSSPPEVGSREVSAPAESPAPEPVVDERSSRIGATESEKRKPEDDGWVLRDDEPVERDLTAIAPSLEAGSRSSGVAAAGAPLPLLHRRPRLMGSGVRACPFPPPEPGAPDMASVGLRIEVAGDGTAGKIEVVDDPGFGFGKAAVDCMRAASFTPARDDAGLPTSDVIALRVRFAR